MAVALTFISIRATWRGLLKQTCQASPQEFLTQGVGVGKRICTSQKCTGRVLMQLVQGRHFESRCYRAF